MASLVDRMVTEYVLDSRGYTHGTNQVVRDSHRAGQAIDHAKAKAHGFGMSLGGFMNGIGNAIRGAVVALGAAGASVVGLGVYAMKTAADFDTLQRTLTAVTGSAERAKQILAFVDDLAVPSVFGTRDLADAAKTLEAFGLQTEKYLPVVEKLGTVFGGSAEKLDQFVRALGYIKGGRFGEGFEALAAAGISRGELGKKGLQFDAGGGFLGDAEQALNAIEQLVREKYGRLAEDMANGPAARLASLWDNIQRGIRAAGNELLTAFLPYIDLISEKVSAWVKDGSFADIGKKIAEWFAPDGPIIKGILTFAAYVAELPDAWEWVRWKVIDVANSIVDLTNKFIDFYNKLANIIKTISDIGAAIGVGGGLGSYVPIAGHVDKLSNPFNGGQFNPSERAQGWQDALTEAYNAAKRKAAGKKGGYEGEGMVADVPAALSEVASNTAELVAIGKRQLQLQEGAMGGGSVGRIGLAPREVLDIRRRSMPAMAPG